MMEAMTAARPKIQEVTISRYLERVNGVATTALVGLNRENRIAFCENTICHTLIPGQERARLSVELAAGKVFRIPTPDFIGPFVMSQDRCLNGYMAVTIPTWASRLDSVIFAMVHGKGLAGAVEKFIDALADYEATLITNRILKVPMTPGVQGPLMGGHSFLTKEEVGLPAHLGKRLVESILTGHGDNTERVREALFARITSYRHSSRLVAEAGKAYAAEGPAAVMEMLGDDLVDMLDGMQVIATRFPVVWKDGVPKMTLRIVHGFEAGCLFIHPVAVKELMQGDFDGDDGGIVVLPEEVAEPEPLDYSFGLTRSKLMAENSAWAAAGYRVK
jgi:hypothetical protein